MKETKQVSTKNELLTKPEHTAIGQRPALNVSEREKPEMPDTQRKTEMFLCPDCGHVHGNER